MNQLTNDLFARRYLGEALSEDVVAWALAMLEAGYDTESLGILAGLTPPYSWQEVERYFAKAMAELGWTAPDEYTAAHRYLRPMVDGIVAGRIAPQEGSLRVLCVAEGMFPRVATGVLSEWSYEYDMAEGLGEGRGLSEDQILKLARRYLAETADLGM